MGCIGQFDDKYSFSILLMATILIRLLSKYPLLRLVLDYDISERDQ